MVYRYLRTLEGVSPPLSLTHLACQSTAKAFISARTSSPLSHLSHTSLILMPMASFAYDVLHHAALITVFDRMFSLGVRGSGTDTAPLGARVAAVAGSATSGPRRHFLYCSLHGETNQRSKRSREQS